jgi:uncharacterized membrane protein
MEKLKKENKVQIDFSNKLLYILIAVVMLVLIGVTVYASNPEVFGHSVNEVGFPTNCQPGQFLIWNGNSWACSDLG